MNHGKKVTTPKYTQINLLHKKDIIPCLNDKSKKWNSNNWKLIDLKAPSTSTWGPNLKLNFSCWDEHKKTTWIESDEWKPTIWKDKLVITKQNAPVLLKRSKVSNSKR